VKFAKSYALVCLFLVGSANLTLAADYPVSPDPRLTPGSLCDRPSEKRYPEGIPYCARRVSSETKREVMVEYDRQLGFRVTQMNRQVFKIDHYIPLCMGGSNEDQNLWPQHESVYAVTDPLEGPMCEKMAKGKLRQSEAVELIKRAKADLGEARKMLSYVLAL
jgi:hypothetical protein